MNIPGNIFLNDYHEFILRMEPNPAVLRGILSKVTLVFMIHYKILLSAIFLGDDFFSTKILKLKKY